MKLNPVALAFWLLLSCVGYLYSSTLKGAIWGFVIGITLSITAELFLDPR